MHASIFRLDFGERASARERWRCGRALAAALASVNGFVGFMALETVGGVVTGLCICVDAAALNEAEQVADAWQRERGRQPVSAMQPRIAGEVIVQRGL